MKSSERLDEVRNKIDELYIKRYDQMMPADQIELLKLTVLADIATTLRYIKQEVSR